ncbi:hypothetical protein DOY81_011576 [Sarcophaga bullata]|nr:hypothetical protein DOY81_011576 [Sarcophaga bullata]
MISILLSRICILTFGTLYPGYISFKTVRAKVVDDYLKWMMYWIVFAIFTVMETFTDIFLTWLPFYYEIKMILIFWLLPTIGNGSSFIYRNFIHRLLKNHEQRIDQYLERLREKGQDLILQYVKEAFLCVKQTILNVINRKLPNMMLAVLSNTANESDRSLPEQSSVIIEEIEEQEMYLSNVIKPANRKETKKTSTKREETAVAARTSRSRMRKTRNPTQEN